MTYFFRLREALTYLLFNFIELTLQDVFAFIVITFWLDASVTDPLMNLAILTAYVWSGIWIKLIKCKTRFDVTWHRKQSILCEAEKFYFSFEKRRFLFLWKERGECLHLRMDVNIFCSTISWHQNDSGVVIFRITGTHSIKSNLTCKTELMWLTGSS